MALEFTRRTVITGSGLLVLLAGAFGAGAWAGGDWVGRLHGQQALQRASASASLLHRKLVQLDGGDAAGLREGINMELDGELLGMCVLTEAGPGRAREDVAQAMAILQRIARYRAEQPATYPPAYLGQGGEGPRKRLEACLAAARSSPGR